MEVINPLRNPGEDDFDALVAKHSRIVEIEVAIERVEEMIAHGDSLMGSSGWSGGNFKRNDVALLLRIVKLYAPEEWDAELMSRK
jgi:hypothetical protein